MADTTSPRQPNDIVDIPPLVDQTDGTELVPSVLPTADPRYPIEETESVPSGNVTAGTETSLLTDETESVPSENLTVEAKTNLLTDETELVPWENLSAETETNFLTIETEFVSQNMAVEVHNDTADNRLRLESYSNDSVKDPIYVPDTVRSPPSLHNSSSKQRNFEKDEEMKV